MLESLSHTIANIIELVGIAVIILGAAWATFVFLRRLSRQTGFSNIYQDYRASLGRAILLGLEFLVAADIIGTVSVDPNFTDLGVLGLIVLIRTFLSFSLEVEINGRWPWEEARQRNGVR